MVAENISERLRNIKFCTPNDEELRTEILYESVKAFEIFMFDNDMLLPDSVLEDIVSNTIHVHLQDLNGMQSKYISIKYMLFVTDIYRIKVNDPDVELLRNAIQVILGFTDVFM
jgi:hypothetical protein